MRRGEKASPIVFYKEQAQELHDDETGATKEEKRLIARASWVFNADQVDGWSEPDGGNNELLDPIEDVDALVRATKADVRYGGTNAYYAPSADCIVMPDRERFIGTSTSSPTESFYAVLLHELTHWTAHAKRLDRDLSGRFGDASYAMEELVAELGAAFLCAELKIANEPRTDHVAYIDHWLLVLPSDYRAIFLAARKASVAVKFLKDLNGRDYAFHGSSKRSY